MAQLKRTLARLALVLVGLECGLRLLAFGYRVQQLYRLGAPEETLDPGACRILCVGESTTRGVPGPLEESYPARLERLLRARYPRARVEVYNRGVAAISAYDIYAHLPGYLRQTRPRLVILQAGNNGGSIWPDFQGSGAGEKLVSVLNRSKLLKVGLLGWRILALACRGSLSVRTSYRDAYLVPEEGRRSGMDERSTRRYLELSVRRIREMGVPVVLCGYFDSPTGNQLLEEVSRELGAPLCRNDLVYRDYLRKGRAAELISADGWHPSARGYSLMARNLFEMIARDPLSLALSAPR